MIKSENARLSLWVYVDVRDATWVPARNRPLKREGLIAHLHSHFAKKVAEPELRRIVSRMIAEK